MRPPLLEATDLKVEIGGVEILHGVTLAIASGMALGLVGESGSGKTMTARALTGMLKRIGGRITGGTIALAGRDVTRASEKQWRRLRGREVALVPQNSLSSLDPLMTVEAQVAETVAHTANGSRTSSDGEVARLLRQVHLEPSTTLLKSYSHELSGGMRQRVMIALALATRPALLIADEPTTALDVSVRSGILDLLAELRRETGLALILISHDLVSIERATDEVLVMRTGEQVEAGRTREVISNPRMPYTRALMLARPEANPPGRPIPLLESVLAASALEDQCAALTGSHVLKREES
ncbi:MAG: ABC transporter ATP-binding protein [Bifidobacteriaceae bacterium]|jgi:peptide/nickel transport system ATP-binding protein|nr:ABC transporter ATP-binding protein [Bifidobacteriaceae bacterium]